LNRFSILPQLVKIYNKYTLTLRVSLNTEFKLTERNPLTSVPFLCVSQNINQQLTEETSQTLKKMKREAKILANCKALI